MNDIVIVDDLTLRLRAERSGAARAAIYTMTWQATNGCGATAATATVTVLVPTLAAPEQHLIQDDPDVSMFIGPSLKRRQQRFGSLQSLWTAKRPLRTQAQR